jgi:L-asparagine transporter-like permease
LNATETSYGTPANAPGLTVARRPAIAVVLPDMLIRVFNSPRFSPSLILGRLIVRNQVPEYVGAPQKRYAWVIGVVLASLMFILVNVMNTYSPISGLICLARLVFLFFETAFGICLGCQVYALVYRERAQYCPGEVCERGTRQEIQNTSGVHVLIAAGFVAYVVLVVFLFNDSFGVQPHALFGR